MLSKKKLEKYLKKRWKGMLETTQELSLLHDPGQIHVLRLHGKKIKAVAALMVSAGGCEKDFSLRLIQPLIRCAGDIRMAEMNLKTLHECNFNQGGILGEQARVIEKGYAILRAENDQFKTDLADARDRFLGSLKNVKNRVIKKYYDGIIQMLSLAFLWPVDEEQLHENRKHIKNMIFIMKLLPGKLKKEIGLNTKYLDLLQEDIGRWHDLTLTSCVLSEHRLEQDPVFCQIKLKEKSLLECIKAEAAYFDEKVAATPATYN
jgi:CHAD domain-containing protein